MVWVVYFVLLYFPEQMWLNFCGSRFVCLYCSGFVEDGYSVWDAVGGWV